MNDQPRVTVWHEYRHEHINPKVAEVYPQGMHTVIAAGLRAHGLEQVRTATQATQENVRAASQLAQDQVSTATQATQENVRSASEAVDEQVKRNYKLMNTAQIKAELAARGLDTSGSLEDMRARLREADAKA